MLVYKCIKVGQVQKCKEASTKEIYYTNMLNIYTIKHIHIVIDMN